MRRTLSILVPVLLFTVVSCTSEDPVAPANVVTIQGTSYPTVDIGTQTWTSVNYAGPGGTAFDGKPVYGKYYLKSELSSIVLPDGWRIPTQDDYQKLAGALQIEVPSKPVHAEAIKALISKENWKHATGTNGSGFNAQPGGYIFQSGPPQDGDIAEFWAANGVTMSIQEAGENLTSLRVAFYQSDNSPDYRFNVRFVKDKN